MGNEFDILRGIFKTITCNDSDDEYSCELSFSIPFDDLPENDDDLCEGDCNGCEHRCDGTCERDELYSELAYNLPEIDRVIFNDPATIIYWYDGTKTVVRCGKGETFERYTGFMAAVCKKLFGSTDAAKRLMDDLDVGLVKEKVALEKKSQKEYNRKKNEEQHAKAEARRARDKK